MSDLVSDVFARFAAEGDFQACEPIESGHIHTTSRVEARTSNGPRFYLLQRINTRVFRKPVALMQNIVLVKNHLRQRLSRHQECEVDRCVPQVIPSLEQRPYLLTESGEYWRLYSYVSDAHTATDNPQLDEIYEVAYGFGEFIALLADLPQQQLTETIPNFHHGPLRYEALQAAIRQDACQRVAATQDAIEFISEHQGLLAEPQRLIDEHEVPLRVTHNDTKSNNVLLDNASRKALCVIDLDTVMPGLALYDFGDLVRTTATGVTEDERDLDKVRVQLPRIEHALRGFIDGAQGHFTLQEVKSLLLGPSYMALIMAVRFLTDYLQGDVYYHIQYADQNLVRCRAQLAIVQSLEASRDAWQSWLIR